VGLEAPYFPVLLAGRQVQTLQEDLLIQEIQENQMLPVNQRLRLFHLRQQVQFLQ
jgi:hypothetical protein